MCNEWDGSKCEGSFSNLMVFVCMCLVIAFATVTYWAALSFCFSFGKCVFCEQKQVLHFSTSRHRSLCPSVAHFWVWRVHRIYICCIYASNGLHTKIKSHVTYGNMILHCARRMSSRTKNKYRFSNETLYRRMIRLINEAEPCTRHDQCTHHFIQLVWILN